MFLDNPFLEAAEQFVAASLNEFATVRNNLSLGVDGEGRVEVLCYMEPPPSDYGYLKVNFSYDQASLTRLLQVREAVRWGDADYEEAALEADECVLHMEICYETGLLDEDDAQSVADRLAEVLVEHYPEGPPMSNVRVDLVKRFSQRAKLLAGNPHNVFAQAGVEVLITASEVHARDWNKYVKNLHEVACCLAEAVHGRRPPERGSFFD